MKLGLLLGCWSWAWMLSAMGAAPEVHYFDPPSGKLGATVSLHGKGFSSLKDFKVITRYVNPTSDDPSAKVVSDTELTFRVNGWPFAPDHNVMVMLETEDGLTITRALAPPNEQDFEEAVIGEVLPGVEIDHFSLGAHVVVVRSGAEYVLPGQDLVRDIYLVESGATLDMTAYWAGPVSGIVTIYYEEGATLIRPTGRRFKVPDIRVGDVGQHYRITDEPLQEVSVDWQTIGNGRLEVFPDKDTYYAGDYVIFTAQADPGWGFESWNAVGAGDESSYGVTLDFNYFAEATFIQGKSLTLTQNESGEITLSPQLEIYPVGTEVVISFTPKLGHTFESWNIPNLSEEDRLKNPLTLSVSEDLAIAAKARLPIEKEPLWTLNPGFQESSQDRWTEIAVAEDGTFYVGHQPSNQADSGTLFAISPSGTVKWRKTLAFTSLIERRPDGSKGAMQAFTPPVIDLDGNLYITSGHKLYAFDPNGVTLWERAFRFIFGASPRFQHLLINGSGELYLADGFSNLYLLDPKSGATLKEFSGDTLGEDLYPQQCSLDVHGRFFVPVRQSNVYHLTPDFEILWKERSIRHPDSYWSPAINSNNKAYFVHGNVFAPQTLFAWSLNGGRPQELGGTLGITGPPVIDSADNLYMTNDSEELLKLDENGTPLWRISNIANQAPILAEDGTLFAISSDPREAFVHALDPSGELKWQSSLIEDSRGLREKQLISFEGRGDTSPPHVAPVPVATFGLAPQNLLYVASRNGKIYAFETEASLATSPWPKTYGGAGNRSQVLPLAPNLAEPLPETLTVIGGQSTTLALEAQGRPEPTVQWFRDGDLLEGQTSSSLFIRANAEAGGDYHAVLTNSEGVIETNRSTVAVHYRLTTEVSGNGMIKQSSAASTFPAGTSVRMVAEAEPPFVFVRWEGLDLPPEPVAELVMDQHISVVAVFEDQGAPLISLDPLPDPVANRMVVLSGFATDTEGSVSVIVRSPLGIEQEVVPVDGRFESAPLWLNEGANVVELIALDETGNETKEVVTVTWEPQNTLWLTTDGPAQEGSLVQLELKAAQSMEMAGGTFRLDYDPDFLEPLGFVFSDLLQDGFATQDSSRRSTELSFALSEQVLPETKTALGSMSFRVRSVPVGGEVSLVELRQIEAFGSSGELLNGITASGFPIRLTERKLHGDINANDRLDLGDAYRLNRLVRRLDEVRSWDITANDRTGNERLDSADTKALLEELTASPSEGEAVTLLEDVFFQVASSSGNREVGDQLPVTVKLDANDTSVAAMACTLSVPRGLVYRRFEAEWSGIDVVEVDEDPEAIHLIALRSHSDVTNGTQTWGTFWFEIGEDFAREPQRSIALTNGRLSIDDGYTVSSLGDSHHTLVTQGRSYARWLFASIPADRIGDDSWTGESQDPDGDGLPNLAEYVLGTSPVLVEPERLPKLVQQTTAEGVQWGLTFTQDLRAIGRRVSLEWSENLKDWRVTENSTETVSPSGTEWLETKTISSSAGSARYWRLRVE